MAPNDSTQTTEESRDPSTGRRRAARYVVPVAVAGVAAATIGLVPALAAPGDPELPKITAQQLIERIAASDVEQLSGTVKVTTDLGLPSLAGLEGLAPGGGSGSGSAAPQDKLMELASGTHTLRVAADGPDRQKLSVLDKAAEYSLIHNGADVWAFDSASNEVFHDRAEAPSGARPDAAKPEAPAGKDIPATPKDFADEALKAVDDTTSVTVDGTTRIAGRDAYQLVIKPKQGGSTIGSVKVAVDAEKGVPLKFTLMPSGGGKAAIDAGFTTVDFARPDASTFDFKAPKGAKVTEADEAGKAAGVPEGHGKPSADDLAALEDFQGLNVLGKGWTSVAEISAPGGKGVPKGEGGLPAEAQGFLDALGDKVTGSFGSGTVFKTRLVNALMTDDGRISVGAVTPDTLVATANAAK
ncbi:LolA family protein [Streptomyces sp. SP18CS02]|uniref:LolA family protein n=1 Tax=Streptomyces sp. SP18CS02 TaxID=3002531 RepID=UPI002E768157|nr:DUF2092 domain-containing protein [Streptomyces sp. SP18CS02]MEE1751798.1 sigma-E factor regulatory protein RseB domain-containing protein [Streptomyces sp. SP18CS02]